jgi:hypothetical protein
MNSEIAVYVMSCDKTADVASIFVQSFRNYWAACSYKIFFGINRIDNHLKNFPAELIKCEPSNWRKETLVQIDTIRNSEKQVSHLLVFLDDFIFSKNVDPSLLDSFLDDVVAHDIKYMGLIPNGDSVIAKAFLKGEKITIKPGICCHKIRKNHPYYTSLQVALWDINYLYDCVERSSGIWNFETLHSDVPHYAVNKKIMHYKHIVEKGEWDFNAKSYCERNLGFFLPGNRKFRERSLKKVIRHQISKYILFPIFGYLFLQIRTKYKSK